MSSGTPVPGVGRSTVPVEIEKRQGAYLPHWRKDGGIYFVTFRLADSVPKEVSLAWKAERERLDRLEKERSIALSPAEVYRYRILLRDEMDRYLDAGHGACILKKTEFAAVVQNALLFFHEDRYFLHAWAVMPNHVHALVEPSEKFSLEKITHSWKSYTSHQIGKLRGEGGQIWQPEPYDHLIRDGADFSRCQRYILENPSLAGLANWKWAGENERDAHSTHARDGRATGTT